MSIDLFRKYIDIINENAVDITQIASQLEFLPTKKQAKQYKFVGGGTPGKMPAMTYTVSDGEQPVVTVTSDGKETQNVAEKGDIIMSGPSRENYVVKAAKFPKLYQGQLGQSVVPEQNPRMVAAYTGNQPVTFTAPWGENMILKPGDYLVKDGDQGYYRVAKVEYEQTYNQPGK
jgi:PGDYG protein